MVSYEALQKKEQKIAVVGLGYVGLPLAVHLAVHFRVVGFDLDSKRIEDLKSGIDNTREIEENQLLQSDIFFTDDPGELRECSLMIVAVPTPIDRYRIPDLGPLESASVTVGRYMKKGSCVVFESTVFPGATEEVCVPLIERESGFTLGKDFTVGYSPERINPGDKKRTIENIVKIVSASDPQTLELLGGVYGKIVSAGLHMASSIKVAEAAKVIENTQRDLNIALMNELSMIFDKLGIDTAEVLEAAGTKWNFLPFKPGLVGGHCIGVDPYYLTFKAESIGYHPEIILAGRRINDNMGKYVAERTIKILIGLGKQINSVKIAVLGLTFKENVPDLRNTKVIDIIDELKDYGVDVLVNDPLADPDKARDYYGLQLRDIDEITDVDAVVVSVIHEDYKKLGLERIAGMCKGEKPLIIDVKSAFNPREAEKLGIGYWRL